MARHMRRDRIQDAVVRINEFGLKRNSSLFFHALVMFAFLKQEQLTKNFEALWMLGWSNSDGCEEDALYPRHVRPLQGCAGFEVPDKGCRSSWRYLALHRPKACADLIIVCSRISIKAKGWLNADVDFYNMV